MADLRPLGSEKLQGMDKIKRIMEIARYNESPKQEINELSTTNYTIKLSDGNTYAIVKEKLGYIIKNGLNESTFEYSEPIRHRKYYRSYSEAMKKLNLMVVEINRTTGFEENVPLIGEQQSDTKKKFILKTPKPKNDASIPSPVTASEPPMAPPMAPTPPADDMGTTPPPADDMGTPPADDMGMPPADDMGVPPSDDMGMPPADDMGMDPSDDMGEDDEEAQGPMGLKSIQKLTGKLSQKIRAFDKEKGLDSQDIKYVLNSIISALDLENLDEDDKDDVLSKFDESDEYGEEGPGDLDFKDTDMEMGMEGDEPTDEEYPQPPVSESSVDKVLNGYFNIKSTEKPLTEEKRKKDYLKNKLNKLSVKSEIGRLSESDSQSDAALSIMENYEGAKFIGKTNKDNLIFVIEDKQYKVTPAGRIL